MRSPLLLTALAPVLAVGIPASAAHAGTGDLLHRVLPDPGYDALQFGEDVDIKDGLAIVSGLGIFTTPVDGGAWIVDVQTGELLSGFPQPADPDTGEPISSRFYGVAISRPVLHPAGHTAPVALVGTVESPPCNCYRPLLRAYDLADPANPVLMWSARPEGFQFDDDFASAIEIEGTVALVGAPSDSTNGPLAGAAHLFDITTGAQLGTMLASDGGSLDQLAFSVDLDNGLAILGARWQTDAVSRSGAAYIFDVSDPANPVQLARLKHADEDINDYFGYEVAIHNGPAGAIAAVGSIFDDDLGLDSGAVYLYDLTDPANPTLATKLLAADGQANDDFGWAVALDADAQGRITALIGARTDDDAGSGNGSAYFYDVTDPAAPLLLIETLPGPVTNVDTYGWAVALDNGIAVVGSPNNDDLASNSGVAYFLDASRGPAGCNAADLAEPFGLLDLGDITAFVAAFSAGDPAADLDGSGLLDLADINVFVAAFVAGCP